MHRLGITKFLLVGVLTAGGLAFAAPSAQAETFCVSKAGSPCTQTSATLQEALNSANLTAGPDDILIGPGVQTDPGTGFSDTNVASVVHIIGSGMDSTTLTWANTAGATDGVNLTVAPGSTISNLGILVPPNPGLVLDRGLVLANDVDADHIKMTGPAADNVFGVATFGGNLSDSVIDLPLGASGTVGFNEVNFGGQVSDSTIHARTAVRRGSTGTPTTVLRSRLSGQYGATLDNGKFIIKDTLITLDQNLTGGAGVGIYNDNNGTGLLEADLDGVTIVGGAGSTNVSGVKAQANALTETANLDVTNSLITGVDKSLDLIAGNGRTTTANVSYSAYDGSKVSQIQSGAMSQVDLNPGSGLVTDLTGDPGFKDPANGDYTPLATSTKLVDKGDPAAPAVDRKDVLGHDRACNGTPGGSKIRDIGAFEYNDCIDPDTSINGGPGPQTTVRAPGFTLASNKPFVTFRCTFDNQAPATCPQLATAPDLGLGAHHLSVIAVDQYGNTDKTPATYDYTVVKEPDPPSCATDASLCPPPTCATDATLCPDKTAPVVTIVGKVPKRTSKRAVKIKFKSNEAGSTFTCKVGKKKAKKCKSPFKAKLKKGKANKVTIVATDKAGNHSKPKVVKVKRK